MRKMVLLAALPAMSAGLLAMLTACEKPITPESDDGNVHLTFVPTTHDVSTRGTVAIGDYFSRLAVQMFDVDGNKVFDKVKTQSRYDDDFGTLSWHLYRCGSWPFITCHTDHQEHGHCAIYRERRG